MDRTTVCTPDKDHLRVCGADFHPVRQVRAVSGSPPRVRSRQVTTFEGKRAIGITSACAEQTSTEVCWTFSTWDHLRVCGADHTSRVRTTVVVGSPPRVRSRQWCALLPGRLPGITSACAEQTDPWSDDQTGGEDHLRVCGADRVSTISLRQPEGSPPRVRSRRGHAILTMMDIRITSACAEQTPTRPALHE